MKTILNNIGKKILMPLAVAGMIYGTGCNDKPTQNNEPTQKDLVTLKK